MPIDHAAEKARLLEDEAVYARVPLDGPALLALALDLLDRAPAPIAVKIVVAGRTVVEIAQDGTAGDNSRFLDLKIAAVSGCGHSSLWWHHHLRSTGRTLKDVAWADPHRVVDMGGAMPLFAGGRPVGAVAVSGLAHEDDHGLIVAAGRAAVARAGRANDTREIDR